MDSLPPQTPAAGWYMDPSGRHEHRYHDGTEWTQHVLDNRVPSLDPPFRTPLAEAAVAAPPAENVSASPPPPVGAALTPAAPTAPPPVETKTIDLPTYKDRSPIEPKRGVNRRVLVLSLAVMLLLVAAVGAYVFGGRSSSNDETSPTATWARDAAAQLEIAHDSALAVFDDINKSQGNPAQQHCGEAKDRFAAAKEAIVQLPAGVELDPDLAKRLTETLGEWEQLANACGGTTGALEAVLAQTDIGSTDADYLFLRDALDKLH
jgi:hypothetical protein